MHARLKIADRTSAIERCSHGTSWRRRGYFPVDFCQTLVRCDQLIQLANRSALIKVLGYNSYHTKDDGESHEKIDGAQHVGICLRLGLLLAEKLISEQGE